MVHPAHPARPPSGNLIGVLALVGWLCLPGCSGSTEKPWLDRGSRLDSGATAERSVREMLAVDARRSGDGGAGSCKPYCYPVGSPSQGWYDGCTKQLLKLPGTRSPYYDSCDKCSAECREQPAKGWYSSCSDQLITMGCD